MRSFAPPLRVDLGPSLALTWIFRLIYGAAMLSLLLLPFPWLAKGLMVALLAGSWLREQRLHAARSAPKAIVVLEMGEGDDWKWYTHDQTRIEVGHLDWCYVQPRLIVMGKRIGGLVSCKAVVPWDAMAGDDFRRLTLSLRLTAPRGEGTIRK